MQNIFKILILLALISCGQEPQNAPSEVTDMGLADVCLAKKIPYKSKVNFGDKFKSIVQILGEKKASGFFFNDAGYIVTTWSVVEKCLKNQNQSASFEPTCADLKIKMIKSIECKNNKPVYQYLTFKKIDLIYPRTDYSAKVLEMFKQDGLDKHDKEVAILKVDPNEVKLEKIPHHLDFSNRLPDESNPVYSLGFPLKTSFSKKNIDASMKATENRILSYARSANQILAQTKVQKSAAVKEVLSAKLEYVKRIQGMEGLYISSLYALSEQEYRMTFRYKNADGTPRVSFGKVTAPATIKISSNDILSPKEAQIVSLFYTQKNSNLLRNKKSIINKVLNNYTDLERNHKASRDTVFGLIKLKIFSKLSVKEIAAIERDLFQNENFMRVLIDMISDCNRTHKSKVKLPNVETRSENAPAERDYRIFTDLESTYGAAGSPMIGTDGLVNGIISNVNRGNFNKETGGFDETSRTIAVDVTLPLQIINKLNIENRNSEKPQIFYAWPDQK